MSDPDWLLLCDPSPALRYRVLTEWCDVPRDDPEVVDLARQRRESAELAGLVAAEPADLLELCWVLCRFAQLGLDHTDPVVHRFAERLFARQRPDGSFPLREFRADDTYQMVPLQTALPLRGLASVGLATDPRAERAYDWLLAQRLDDGAWPTGRGSGQPGYVAGYRKLPGSAGCRVNTQAALACLAPHPARAHDEATRRALDLLLQRETRDGWALGSEIARLLGHAPARGLFTFYARFDLVHVLEIAGRIGASTQDGRIAGLIEFLTARQGPAGLWEHPEHPELSRWLTFDILLGLRRVAGGDWSGVAPRTRFRSRSVRRS